LTGAADGAAGPPPFSWGKEVVEADTSYDREIVWCGFQNGTELAKPKPGQAFTFCRGHVHFARWLFAQERGLTTPTAKLMVRWRELKACLGAIIAAQTGVTVGLRLDNQRPPLTEVKGVMPKGELPRIAVNSIVVLTDSDLSYLRAAQYVSKKRDHFPGISFTVCHMDAAEWVLQGSHGEDVFTAELLSL